MATYVLPQVLVFQDFSVQPTAVANPLRAHISGPHAQLIRYDEDDERDDGLLGTYDWLTDTEYAWPERPAGGVVDNDYTKVWIKDALLKYFQDTIGQGSTITKVSGYNNRITSATISFTDNGDDYPRSGSLYDRDVKAGDVAKVRGVNTDGDAVTLWTYVKNVVGVPVSAVVAAATTDTSNVSTSVADADVTFVSGPENCVTVTASASAYDGRPSGDIEEVYDIIVTEGSVNGDYTTALLRVISGSGNDDDTDVAVAAQGQPTAVGSRGLTLLFDVTGSAACSASAADDTISPSDLIAGQRWQVTVTGDFTKPTPSSGGTYTGTTDTTYILTVNRGGAYDADEPPQITVSTVNGYDVSGPTDITAANTAFDVGSYGADVAFTGTGLRKGDRYYIEVTSEADGAMRTIELGHNLDTDISAGSEVDLTLYIRKSILQVAKNRTGFAPLTNWDVTTTEITLNSGIVAYDESWTDDGEQLPLDVHSEESKDYGQVYVEVRYWLSSLSAEVGTIDDVGNIDELIPGALDPDNPLKWGVFKALENANGTEVKFTAVADPSDANDWADVLGLLLGRDDVYNLVPLTRDRTVLDLFAAHVDAQSSPEQALWRVVWVNLEGVPEIPLVHNGSSITGHVDATTTDDEVALAVIEDDPQTSGTQYTLVRNTNQNANFITSGVRAGDILRTLYTTDGFGGTEYSEYVIDEVVAEDELRLLTGPDAPVAVAAKIEVWRNLTSTEEAAEVAANAGAWGDRRVRAVWPDTIESSGTVMPGYFLCASLAGLVSGVLPHQGLTNLEITGYSDVPRTTSKFNRDQLDTMALGGTWIVTQDLSPTSGTLGRIFTRHAVTTGAYDDINAREEVVTRNVDSISFRFKDYFKPFIGVTNVTPVMEARLDLETGKLITTLRTELSTSSLGGQLVEATLAEPIRPHVVFKDRYVIKLNITIPYPLNTIEVRLVI